MDATLRIGWMSPIGARAGVLTAPLATITSGPVDDRYTVPAWAITLANGGNAGTKVASVAVESASGFTFRAIDVVAGPASPLVLEAHSDETVCIELQGVIAGLRAWEEVMGSVSRKVRAEVTLGSGVVVHSEWEMLP